MPDSIVYCLSRTASVVSYHDGIARIASRNWNEVSADLQLRNISDADMPRLLLDCIRDLQRWREDTKGLLKEIESLQARTEQYRRGG